MKQEALFNLHKHISEELKDLGGYIQNDFNRMLEDEYTTLEDIQKASEGYNKQFCYIASQLQELYKETNNLFERFKEK